MELYAYNARDVGTSVKTQLRADGTVSTSLKDSGSSGVNTNNRSRAQFNINSDGTINISTWLSDSNSNNNLCSVPIQTKAIQIESINGIRTQ